MCCGVTLQRAAAPLPLLGKCWEVHVLQSLLNASNVVGDELYNASYDRERDSSSVGNRTIDGILELDFRMAVAMDINLIYTYIVVGTGRTAGLRPHAAGAPTRDCRIFFVFDTGVTSALD